MRLRNGADFRSFVEPTVVGHDWGARAAYGLAALFPERVTTVSALPLAFQPHAIFEIPSFEQSRRFWYQWFLCLDGGAAKVAQNPKGFARLQWETWSPPDWMDEHRLQEIGTISTPTLTIQGASDCCDPPSESEGLERISPADTNVCFWRASATFHIAKLPIKLPPTSFHIYRNEQGGTNAAAMSN
jgi:pimeloyl-ACP methyl ester carboxylesterase